MSHLINKFIKYLFLNIYFGFTLLKMKYIRIKPNFMYCFLFF